MAASEVLRSPSQILERIVQGLYVRAEERLAESLTARDTHKEAAAAKDRVRPAS